jgi:hypothetical protein
VSIKPQLPHVNGTATYGNKRRGGRATTVKTNLHPSAAGVYGLAYAFQENEYHYLPDPLGLYAVMGTMAGNMLTGKPIWMMLAGDSGSGKTSLLKTVMEQPGVRQVSSIKGEAALLSGVSKKDRAKDSTGGILRELGDNGMLLYMDFTSLLSKDPKQVNEMLGILRELYDRTWSRDIGGEGGRSMRHTGRVSLLAGVTHAIDEHAEVSAEMGQRCLIYRLPPTDGYQEGMMAVNKVVPEDDEDHMRRLVNIMFDELALKITEPTLRRKVSLVEGNRLVSIAQLGSRLRTHVPRDKYDRLVSGLQRGEVLTRMAQQMTQLYLGLEAVQVVESERWQIIQKVAMDSMPLIRKTVLGIVQEGERGKVVMSSEKVAKRLQVSVSHTKRVLEDLQILGVIQRGRGVRSENDSDDGGKGWRLTAWAEERLVGVAKSEDERQLESERSS